MPGQTVLIVDDSAAVRRAVTMMAAGAGYTCVEAADGAEALKQLQVHHVDLVVTDLNMPVMDGRVFISKMRAMKEMRFIPVLVLTTECSEEVASDLKRGGVTGVLQKPIARAELLAALSRAGA